MKYKVIIFVLAIYLALVWGDTSDGSSDEKRNNSLDTDGGEVVANCDISTTSLEDERNNVSAESKGSRSHESRESKEESSESTKYGKEPDAENGEDKGSNEASHNDKNNSSSKNDQEICQDIEKSIKNKLGLYCIMDSLVNLKYSASVFLYDVKVCDVEIPLELSLFINSVKAMTKVTEKVIASNDEVCENASYDIAEGSKTSTSSLCINTIKILMTQLRMAMNITMSEMEELHLESSCNTIAVFKFRLSLKDIFKAFSICGSIAA